MESTGQPGSVVLITGAGRGLGRSIARTAASAGARVVVGSRTQSDLDELAAEIASAGGTCLPVRLDVTEIESIEAFVGAAVAAYGRIDGLVNNAGAGITKPSVDITMEEFNSTMALNVASTFFCSQRVARQMISQGDGGAIVNISSMFGQGGVSARAPYCAAKAAVDNLTKSFAVEWAAAGIRVNAVAPGVINTPGFERARRNAPELVAGVMSVIPAGRIAEPGEIARLVMFMLSDVCGSMTGQVVTVDGGVTAAIPGPPR